LLLSAGLSLSDTALALPKLFLRFLRSLEALKDERVIVESESDIIT